MNIGRAAKATGLSVKTIRYYEDIGLVDADRSGNGYRDFGARLITRLRMLARARYLGFGLEQCRQLLALDADPARASRDVQALASRNRAAVHSKNRQLRAPERQLQRLIHDCHGNDASDCAILDGFVRRPKSAPMTARGPALSCASRRTAGSLGAAWGACHSSFRE